MAPNPSWVIEGGEGGLKPFASRRYLMHLVELANAESVERAAARDPKDQSPYANLANLWDSTEPIARNEPGPAATELFDTWAEANASPDSAGDPDTNNFEMAWGEARYRKQIIVRYLVAIGALKPPGAEPDSPELYWSEPEEKGE